MTPRGHKRPQAERRANDCFLIRKETLAGRRMAPPVTDRTKSGRFRSSQRPQLDCQLALGPPHCYPPETKNLRRGIVLKPASPSLLGYGPSTRTGPSRGLP